MKQNAFCSKIATEEITVYSLQQVPQWSSGEDLPQQLDLFALKSATGTYFLSRCACFKYGYPVDPALKTPSL
jgi:hypothetical protein